MDEKNEKAECRFCSYQEAGHCEYHNRDVKLSGFCEKYYEKEAVDPWVAQVGYY